ncbi:MAG: hypothetical protein WKG07_00190 [Hymenobacter sp.]
MAGLAGLVWARAGLAAAQHEGRAQHGGEAGKGVGHRAKEKRGVGKMRQGPPQKRTSCCPQRPA